MKSNEKIILPGESWAKFLILNLNLECSLKLEVENKNYKHKTNMFLNYMKEKKGMRADL